LIYVSSLGRQRHALLPLKESFQLSNDATSPVDTLALQAILLSKRASYKFKSSDNACAIEVRCRFVTSEVPGGFFGYLQLCFDLLQASPKSVQEANGLGLEAFDFSSGSTSWRKAVLPFKKSSLIFNEVQVDLVGDGNLQSEVIVDFVCEALAAECIQNWPHCMHS
jgi:hypothetical protein